MQVLAYIGSTHDVDADTWQMALRVIYTSVKNCSDCQAGDRKYLDFAENFVRRARLGVAPPHLLANAGSARSGCG